MSTEASMPEESNGVLSKENIKTTLTTEAPPASTSVVALAAAAAAAPTPAATSTNNKKAFKSESNGNGSNSDDEAKNESKTHGLVDPWYQFNEPEPEKIEGDLQYTPSYFLRTHSKNNNPADVQTQIWQCCFAPPSALGDTITRDVVATCGGSSVCFIDVTTGDVLLKYNRSTKALASENLYALAWTTLEVTNDEESVEEEQDDESDPIDAPGRSKAESKRSDNKQERTSVVAAGGGKSTVVLVDVEAGFCYHMFRTVTTKASSIICSLLFHPKKHSWLFCGHEDGHIEVWDVGLVSRPNYNKTNCVPLTTLPAVSGDAYNLQYCHKHDLLLAGCDSALLFYQLDMQKIIDGERLEVTKVDLPIPGYTGNGSSVVDSITMVRDTVLAAKCALHARIYVADVEHFLHKRKPAVKQKNVDFYLKAEFEDVVSLEWSDTDNYYMNMGADPSSCVLVCGDDKGTLWLYDLYNLITGKVPSPLTGGPEIPDPIPPCTKLLWPDLDDPEVEKAGKLRLDSYDIVVDKCCIDEGADHVVAVTSNNMVCIWTRAEHSESTDDSQ